jgi:molybdenum cofactor cytidylyltransferase
MPNKRPVVVVLAAGRGRRFAAATHKLLQPFGTTSVLGQTLAHVLASGLPLVVVTTAPLASEAARTVAARDVVVVPETQAALGMGRTLATGVAARSDGAGWLILPADMPLVQPQTLRLVAAALAEHPVAFAQYQGRRGHPVGFAAELYSELRLLDGDEGARRVLARYPAMGVEVDDPGILTDIDTVSDLEAARQAVPEAVSR